MKKILLISLFVMALTALHVVAEGCGAKAGCGAKPESGKEALALELPDAVFTGTPKNMGDMPNLEKPRKGPRPAFLVPKGSTNVALNKTVTSSDMMPIIGDLTLVTDGDKEATEGSYVELGWGKQWVQIDLGAEYNIHAVVVWHFHSDPRVYRDVIVQIGSDADFISGVTTVYNNDHDGSSGLGMGTDKEYVETYEGRIIDGKGTKGRYVRLYSNDGTAGDVNHYTEVEVYATPAK